MGGWDENFGHDEPAEIRAEQAGVNAAMIESLRDQGVAEGTLLSAELTWLCPNEQDAADLVGDLTGVLDRVGIAPPESDDARRALGISVRGRKSIRLSLPELNAMTDQMILIGLRHRARFSSCGFYLSATDRASPP